MYERHGVHSADECLARRVVPVKAESWGQTATSKSCICCSGSVSGL